MKNIQTSLQHEKIKPLFKEVRLGIEKESQRVDLAGNLATTDHPIEFGNRAYHPSIQTDFSETQLEIITPVTSSEEEAMAYLAAIHEVVLRTLPANEMLWPLSMPPRLPLDEAEIKIAKLDKFEDVLYRRYLARSYGKRKQMVSGIHYNFEFSTEFMQALFAQQSEKMSYQAFETEVYLKVARNYLRYRWLITYLFGASPVSEANYFMDTKGPDEPVRSIRNSSFGYTNHDDVFVSYASIASYVSDIESLVSRGYLSEEKEFYSAVRLRGERTIKDMREKGVHYIEIRNIDNNPFAPYGIDQTTIQFLHIFMMYLLWLDNDQTKPDELLTVGEQYNNQVALEHPLAQTNYQAEGLELVSGMQTMATLFDLGPEVAAILKDAEEALYQPAKTIAGQMLSYYQTTGDNQQLAVEFGKKNRQQAWEKPYQLAGFREMELSTQLLLFDSIQKGLAVEVLDRHDQFVKLQAGQQIEYVKNANMTSRDRYIVPLIMENKTVTKKLLQRAGFQVPAGKEFTSIEAAMRYYDYFETKAIVIKPKSTNYGIGISIFKQGASREDYQTALEIAFAADSEVLVEEFIEGTEYRFFVIDGKVAAILLRVPANVTGDGQHTIAELVAEKNRDPLRGTHHRAPLEKIELGDIEQLMLKEQGYKVTSVLPKGLTVYLRENSNISTGGDSIDVTDQFDPSYKELAVAAVAELGAVICGIDLIIPAKDQAVGSKSSQQYSIIEANFNPAMHMHIYPYEGQGRRLTQSVLQLLFGE